MLTADAFGVMPPIARLTPAQAMYHFLSGYTAKVAGTERGVTEPEATFSTCFGAPFMPRHPSEYGDLLRRADRRARRRLLAGQHRLDRRRLSAPAGACRSRRRARCLPPRSTARSTSADFRTDPNFGFAVPVAGRRASTTRQSSTRAQTWADKAAYDRQAKRLVGMFIDNFDKFEAHVDAAVMDAAPGILRAAE